MTETVALEMVSDLVCPWCWLGLRRLKSAVDMVPEVTTEVYFRPYQLDPTVPEAGMDYRDYMKAKFGSDAHEGSEHDESKNRWKMMRKALEDYGAAEGIPFDFDNIPKRPNTVNAHRLVHWAQGQGLGLEAKEALFFAYFAEHRDIGDKAVLADIAEGHRPGQDHCHRPARWRGRQGYDCERGQSVHANGGARRAVLHWQSGDCDPGR